MGLSPSRAGAKPDSAGRGVHPFHLPGGGQAPRRGLWGCLGGLPVPSGFRVLTPEASAAQLQTMDSGVAADVGVAGGRPCLVSGLSPTAAVRGSAVPDGL